MSIQFIKKVTPNKPIRWYVYAYRGGPRIATIESPKKPKLNLEQKRKALEAQEALSNPSNKRLRGLIWEWRRSLAWSEMAQTTRDLWSLELNRIDDKWGDKPVAVWNDIRMKAKVVQWRDSRANTPRQADVGIQALKALLKFGILMGRVRLNVAEDIPQLYKGGGRDEIIWTADDVDRFTKAAIEDGAEHIVDGLRLAAVTGLRRADLVSLTWRQVGEFAIVKTALKKSRGKRRKVAIPRTVELEKVLDDLRDRFRKDGVDNVLVNSRGVAWSGMGYGTSFNRIRNLAKIVHIEEDENGKDVERPKHLHDVRGTFCTLLLSEWDLTDKEAAEIMGWSPERVSRIRKVYVDGSKVVVAIGRRISEKQAANSLANRSDDA
ncbi:tyrosine-type recombinase/integrase [Sphingobium yanoikuyae]|uniref:Site-specific integrase n=1 Tax=Sphingobium yanoikuyae TaxID=13690 RepID=A0A430BZD0_SPHYA|nr:site-specific integrase [Sphingobium yanoikuyae]RSU58055.1 site-specific integrase [Sphingobium yanoikuyae]